MTLALITGNLEDDNGNTIIAPNNLNKVQVGFTGKNNKLYISENSNISYSQIYFPADGGVCIIGDYGSYIGRIRVGWNCLVSIGDRVTTTGACFVYTAESTAVIIGDDCMIAAQVQLRSEDSHAIYDVTSGSRINPSRNIIVGEHVWLAEASSILSGSTIGAGSVIGTRSVVKGKYPNNCVVAGVPSRILKKNTAWERPNIAFREPWIRNNAKEQSLVIVPHAWKETDDSMIKISIGETSLARLIQHEKETPQFDLSSLIA